MTPTALQRMPLTVAALATLSLLGAAKAAAHPEILPATVTAEKTQLLTLAVPEERDDATTTGVEMTVPQGFFAISFAATPGWTREVELGSGGEIVKVIWTAGEDAEAGSAVFQFTGRSLETESYAFPVTQRYSNGAMVNWWGGEEPAPVVTARNSPGQGSTSAVALVLASAGVVLAGIALLRQSGRSQ